MKDVTFIIPAYNEERNIGTLLNSIKQLYPNSRIIVINNNSNDGTQKIAEEFNVITLFEDKQGKGHAIRKGFNFVKTSYSIMLDADNTYNPKDAVKLIEILKNDKFDVILGSRLNGQIENGSITKLNLIGNRILSFFARSLYSEVSDVCTGYWAFKLSAIHFLRLEGLKSSGFEIESEMFAKLNKGGFKLTETPINYHRRSDLPKLNSIKDGIKIFKTLLINKFYEARYNKDYMKSFKVYNKAKTSEFIGK